MCKSPRAYVSLNSYETSVCACVTDMKVCNRMNNLEAPKWGMCDAANVHICSAGAAANHMS